jgi:formylglycine-generating enzyme required for sulfatase activity
MTESIPERIRINMVEIQGGFFLMGVTPEQEHDALDSEKPVHSATFEGFMICRFPVTQGEWQAIMDDNPSDFRGDADLPVEPVGREDAMSFVARLNSLTDGGYRLPTEAEWEYSARGGWFSNGFRYSGSDEADPVAWTSRNS